VQLDILAVKRARTGADQALELGAFELQLGLAQAVFLQHAEVGIDDQHAARAVDDQQVVVLDQRPGVLHADHRRNRQAARDDGGMRGGAAEIGDEAADLEVLELDGVGRRKVVGDHDQVIVGIAALRRASLRALPCSTLSTRSTTCTMSCLRSRR
jgi:hypothetical protein